MYYFDYDAPSVLNTALGRKVSQVTEDEKK